MPQKETPGEAKREPGEEVIYLFQQRRLGRGIIRSKHLDVFVVRRVGMVEVDVGHVMCLE